MTGALTLLAMILLAAMILAPLAARDGALVDDAYISYRYAQRWADGLGLTWNDGSGVEGYSNPLWTISLAGLARLGWAPHRAAVPISLAFSLGTVGLLAAVLRKRRVGATLTAAVLLGLVLDRGFAVWCGSGLETAQAAFLVTAWVAFGLRGPETLLQGFLLGLVSGLLLVARPEAPLWVTLGGSWLVWGLWAPGRVLLGWGMGTLPLPLLGLWHRLAATGHPVPNTFFAKLEAGPHVWESGLRALAGWGGSHLVLVGIVVLLLVGMWRGEESSRASNGVSRLPRGFLALLAGLILFQALFVILAGGDWMGHSRYLAPLLPACFLGVGLLAASRGWVGGGRRGWTILAVLLVMHGTLTWAMSDRIPRYTRTGEVLGRWLREVAQPGEQLAVTAAGAIPYFSGMPTLDVLGLNDAAVAGRRPRSGAGWMPGHARADLDRLLELKPEWVVWDLGLEVNRARMRRLRFEGASSDSLDFRQALLAMPEFRDRYRVDPSAPRETLDAYTVFRLR